MTTEANRKHGGRRGVALLNTMILVLVLATLGSAVINVALASARLSGRRAYALQALNLAMAGAEEAVGSFQDDRNYMTAAGLPGPTRTYTLAGAAGGTITLTLVMTTVTVNGQPKQVRQVTSQATVTSPFGPISRVVRVNVGNAGSIPLFSYTLAARNMLNFNGNISVKNSDNSPSGANVHANGIITKEGASGLIQGNATAVNGIDSNIYGIVAAATPPNIVNPNANEVVFPDVDPQWQADAAAVANTGIAGSSTTFSGGGPLPTMRGRYNGNVVINTMTGNAPAAQINGGIVWIKGDLQMNGVIKGSGTIVVEGRITTPTGGNAVVGADPTGLDNILFISTFAGSDAMNIRLSGTQDFRGRFYAPNGDINLNSQGTPKLYGSVTSRNINIGGTPDIINDKRNNQGGFTQPGFLESKGWEEGPF